MAMNPRGSVATIARSCALLGIISFRRQALNQNRRLTNSKKNPIASIT
jgi:hypothetical protein